MNNINRRKETMIIVKDILGRFGIAALIWACAYGFVQSNWVEKPGYFDRYITSEVETASPSASMVALEPVEEPVKPVAETSVVVSQKSEESTSETVVEPDETVVEGYIDHGCVEHVRYDIPLDDELQDYIIETSEERGVDPAIIIAMIKRESQFDIDVIGDKGKAFGLMQIHPRWHSDRMEKLGVTDLLDPYQNVTVGIDIMAELLDGGKSVEWALMAYNGGYATANRHMEAGTLSGYATDVLEFAEELERR
jgi:hypothetical protein